MFLDSRSLSGRDVPSGPHDPSAVEQAPQLRLGENVESSATQSDPAFDQLQASLRLTISQSPCEPTNGTLSHLAPDTVLPLQQPPVVFFFRKNGLYEKYCQKLCERLEREGLNAKLVTFPVGTTPEVIQAEVERLADTMKGCVVFADETVKKHLEPGYFPGLVQQSLNHIFTTSCLQIVCRKLGIETGQLYNVPVDAARTQEYLSAHRQRFEAVLHAAVRREAPDYIVIDARQIREDPPFFVFGIFESAHQVLRQTLEESGIETQHALSPEGLEYVSPGLDADAAILLREWLVHAGFPREKVLITDSLAGVSPELFLDTRSVWLIGDHHYEQKSQASRELHDFREAVDKLRLGRLLDKSFHSADLDEESEGMQTLEDEHPMRRELWDGDDGLDDPEAVDEIEFPNEGDTAERDPVAELDAKFERFQREQAQRDPFVPVVLPLGLDFLAHAMIESGLLPAEHFRQGQQLVALSLESVREGMRQSASRVVSK